MASRKVARRHNYFQRQIETHKQSMWSKASLLHTECVRDLDLQCKLFIFESILTPFEESIAFDAAWVVLKIGLILKPNHPREI